MKYAQFKSDGTEEFVCFKNYIIKKNIFPPKEKQQ